VTIVYSPNNPNDSNRPVITFIDAVGDSENFIYFHDNLRPSRIRGNESEFHEELIPMSIHIDTTLTNDLEIGGLIMGFGGNTEFEIDWGDGNVEILSGNAVSRNHSYNESGQYIIKISSDNILSFVKILSDSLSERITSFKFGELMYSEFVFATDVFKGRSLLNIEDFEALPPNMPISAEEMFSNTTNWQESAMKSVSEWDVSTVIILSGMFESSDFNFSLENWELNPNAILNTMFFQSAMSPENYARTLLGWANNIYDRGGVVTGKTLNAEGILYSTETFSNISGQFDNVEDARNYLINDLGWTIIDDGKAPLIGNV